LGVKFIAEVDDDAGATEVDEGDQRRGPVEAEAAVADEADLAVVALPGHQQRLKKEVVVVGPSSRGSSVTVGVTTVVHALRGMCVPPEGPKTSFQCRCNAVTVACLRRTA
jgi:hypothetical protein